MHNSIRTRLLVSFIGLAVIPLLLIGVIVGSQTFNVQRNQAIAFQNEIAVRESAKVLGYFQDLQIKLTAVSQQEGLLNLSARDQKIILSSLLNQDVGFDKIFLVNAQGQEIVGVSRAFAIPSTSLINRIHSNEFRVPSSSNIVYYGSVETDPDSKEPVVTTGIPIENVLTGKVDGVLIANLRMLGAQNLVAADVNELNNETNIYLIDPANQVIAHNDPSVALRGLTFVPPTEDTVQNGLKGEDAVVATEQFKLGSQTFTIVTETPTAQALALAYSNILFSTGLILLVLVVSIVVAFSLVNQIVRPMSALAKTAQAIQQGDFSKRTQIDRQDEIGQFAAAFNEMTDAIQKREADLIAQADALRIATARAKEAARVKGEFLANVSHELRTPLNAIIGFSDMLLAGMSGPLSDKQVHKMERLRENGRRLLALINDLLDLTRIEAGRLEMVEKSFSPKALAERMTAQMESLAVESKLKFDTIVGPDVPETVQGDEKRVEQVIVNLLSNAFKFTEQGSVTLNINANQKDKTWTLDVIDTGIGIPPHAVNVIFEEFRQLDGSYSRAYKGSGLGLAITRNLVRMMGGKINVKSTLGSGSTFTVTLPMSIHEASEPVVLQPVAV